MNRNAQVIGLLMVVGFGLGCIGSWVMNIVKLFWLAQATDPNIIMAIIRAVGIFVIPMGVILGIL